MPIRSCSLALALAVAGVIPAPALARDAGLPDAAEKLSDPQAQLAASAALAALAQTILDIRVEPFTRALRQMGDDSMADLPPDARLGDVAGPRAREVPSDVARNVPKAMGSAAAMAGAFEQMLPELQQTVRRMKDAVPGY